jgi:hypothetical protein
MQSRWQARSGAHASNGLARPDVIAFVDQKLLIVAVCAEPRRIVPDDHELSVAGEPAA